MKKMILSALALMLCLCCAGAGLAEALESASVWYYDGEFFENTLTAPRTAQSVDRIATRSGPGTNYDELGSYHKAGYILTVLSRAYDDRNGIWWLQVELNYGSELRRVYTGLKRVDIDINLVQDEGELCYAQTLTRYIPYYGPGTNYTAHKDYVPASTVGSVYAFENGWVQFEYFDEGKQQYRRVWLPITCMHIFGGDDY